MAKGCTSTRVAALSWGAVLAMGASLASAPASAQVLPADPQDFQCYTLMQDRRAALLQNRTLPPTQRADIYNNLTIISAFYAGRISHYSSAEAVGQFQSARAELDGATPEQRDAFANICANFYVSVTDLLGSTMQSVTQVRTTPQTAVPPAGSR